MRWLCNLSALSSPFAQHAGLENACYALARMAASVLIYKCISLVERAALCSDELLTAQA